MPSSTCPTVHPRLRRLCERLLALAIGGLPALGHTQDGAAVEPLFAGDTPLVLTIEAPFRTLSRERRNREERDGTLRYQDPAGATVTLDVQIRTRGNSRLDVCTYPPLRLDFRRGQVRGTMFAGQNQLKLATLCKDITAYRDYLGLEFEIYRLFNALTDASYRVRWTEIEYVDTDGGDAEPERRPAFLIESDVEVAERNAMEVWEIERLDPAALEPGAAALVSVFHFMIGNTDWSGVSGPPGDRCCHNGDVLRNAQDLAVLIPYDFDQSGLIDADYAAPAEALPIRSVRQRLYRGYCAHNAALDGAIERVRAARSGIEAAIDGASVRNGTRARARRYIEDFFAIVDDPEEREDAIASACRG
ncbi:MAG TPA: hypothetical protein VLD39_07975 [Gammaproteobacteria bacterium]|nr:hypothetical protein [Gammaproteobacteria bacterium]